MVEDGGGAQGLNPGPSLGTVPLQGCWPQTSLSTICLLASPRCLMLGGLAGKKEEVPSCHLSVQSHWHWSLTRRLRRALKQRACPPGLLFLLSSPPPLPSPFSSPGSTSTYLPSEVCADMESSWQYTASLSLDMHALRIYFLKIKCICFSLL